MAMSEEQEEKLRTIQDKAIDHAIEEMNASDELGIDSREDRGDRYFLTKMAKESLTVAAKIEGFIMLRTREGRYNPDPNEENDAINRMIKRARGEVESILRRAKEGMPAK